MSMLTQKRSILSQKVVNTFYLSQLSRYEHFGEELLLKGQGVG